MKTNVRAQHVAIQTHEGGSAKRINAEQQLRRSVMSCMLWESEFYEDGRSIADRIAETVPLVSPATVQAIAIEAREQMKLRHVPLLVSLAMLRSPAHRPLVAATLERVIQRADELAEVIAMYWKDGKKPLPAQLKKGVARAFPKFDVFQLARYRGDGNKVSLRDALFLTHPKHPQSQYEPWVQLAEKTLPTPTTPEVKLTEAHTPEAKRAVWETLIAERKLGALALLRNLRNMLQVNVPLETIRGALSTMKVDLVLPFRFLAAARYAPILEPELEQAMFRCVAGHEKLTGRTVVLVDVSGSMDDPLSSRSEMTRMDAAAGVAILLREIADDVAVYTFSDSVVMVPARRGMALRDAIISSQPHHGTYLGEAMVNINAATGYDRIIVLTDEQAHDTVTRPTARGYVVNVASAQNGVGYGAWVHIDGFSDAIVGYIQALEKETLDPSNNG